MSSDYEEIPAHSVIPTLESLGFSRVRLKGCMRPEILLRRGPLSTCRSA